MENRQRTRKLLCVC